MTWKEFKEKCKQLLGEDYVAGKAWVYDGWNSYTKHHKVMACHRPLAENVSYENMYKVIRIRHLCYTKCKELLQ
jgi:hypothetical protein